MALAAIPYPLRVRYVNTDPVHAARSIRAGGHNTACLLRRTTTSGYPRTPQSPAPNASNAPPRSKRRIDS